MITLLPCDFSIKRMGMTQRELPDGIKVLCQRINDLVNGRRGITPATALCLAKFFDVSEELWMTLQLHCETYDAYQDEKETLATIEKTTS
ncbi:MAG: HigA family addiction module antidote protein [Anaerolineaceae bacterium]|nr:HigA family addiction module antidote protein [Anaerolineaceae bacterium]